MICCNENRQPTQLGVKYPAEIDVLTFDYTDKLLSGETINPSPVMTCLVLDGTDLTPQDVFSGAAQVVGLTVLQQIIGGLPGVTYLAQCTATLSSGRILILLGALPVEDV